MKLPICMQIQSGENGLAAVQSILGYYKKFVPTEELRKHCNESRNGIAIDQLLLLANHYQLKGEISSVSFDELKTIKLPCIITWKRKYYVVLKSIKNKVVKIMDPSKGNVTLTLEKLQKDYGGKVLTLEKDGNFKPSGKKDNSFRLIKNRLGHYKGALIFFITYLIMMFIASRNYIYMFLGFHL